MQPYFMPYIGYFQLIHAVDEFVIYDNIQFSKGGWIQRNRILLGDRDQIISLPLKHDSDFLNINQRYLADSFNIDHKKLFRKIEAAYRKAPNYQLVMPLIECCLIYTNWNLFQFIFHSLKKICEFLDISTTLITSSDICVDHSLKGKDKVLAICKKRKCHQYINAIGGQHLYNKADFAENGVQLLFLKSIADPYKQYDDSFVANLSIIDVLMFNRKETVREKLNHYEFI